jgi:hypothetical protein
MDNTICVNIEGYFNLRTPCAQEEYRQGGTRESLVVLCKITLT